MKVWGTVHPDGLWAITDGAGMPPVTEESLRAVKALMPARPEYDCVVLLPDECAALQAASKWVKEAKTEWDIMTGTVHRFFGLEVFQVATPYDKAARLLELTAEGRRPLTV